MRRLPAHVSAVALLLVCTAASPAGYQNPHELVWFYNFTPASAEVFADGTTSSGVSFSNEPTKWAVGSSDIVATNLRVFSETYGYNPDTDTYTPERISGANGDYSLKLALAVLGDGDAPEVHALTFTGTLSGTLSIEGTNVRNTFGPDSQQQAELGGFVFEVTLGFYTPPGPPDQENAGALAAHVLVRRDYAPYHAPEPSSLALSGLALSLLGGAAWRRRTRPQR